MRREILPLLTAAAFISSGCAPKQPDYLVDCSNGPKQAHQDYSLSPGEKKNITARSENKDVVVAIESTGNGRYFLESQPDPITHKQTFIPGDFSYIIIKSGVRFDIIFDRTPSEKIKFDANVLCVNSPSDMPQI